MHAAGGCLVPFPVVWMYGCMLCIAVCMYVRMYVCISMLTYIYSTWTFCIWYLPSNIVMVQVVVVHAVLCVSALT